jgi:hypothetical protein
MPTSRWPTARLRRGGFELSRAAVFKERVADCPQGWQGSLNGKHWELTTWFRISRWRKLAAAVNQYMDWALRSLSWANCRARPRTAVRLGLQYRLGFSFDGDDHCVHGGKLHQGLFDLLADECHPQRTATVRLHLFGEIGGRYPIDDGQLA